jgi:catechol 2,3-dioxygenase-like lactoylglutathione lyase family enzyme
MTSGAGSGRPTIEWRGVCLDCRDAEAMAAFYGKLLGWEVTARDGADTRSGGAAWIGMRDPAGGVNLSFQAEEWYEPPVWPESHTAQTKMMHFEVAVDDLEAAVNFAVSAGATIAPHQPRDRDPNQLRIMLDPAGHPFCLGTD